MNSTMFALLNYIYRYLWKSHPNLAVPILQGKSFGKKWILGSTQVECALGNYESGQRILLEKMISNGDIVYDIGANVGYYTLLAELLTGKSGKVIAFEPVPRNLHYLKKHLEINNITTVDVIEKAVSDENGSTLFCLGANFAMGHVYSDWVDKHEDEYITVSLISIDKAIEEDNLPIPNCIKIDVEGAETRVLHGAKSLINQYHPKIFLSIHSNELRQECFEFLKSVGYHIEPIDNSNPELAYEIYAYVEHA